MSSNSTTALAKRSLAFEKVRTHIAFEDRPPSEDADMNTRDWIKEEGEQNNFRILTTLDPAHLQSADYVSLSHLATPAISFIPRTLSFPIRFYKKDATCQPFPPGTRGFLYYHVPQHLPAMAGGLRFRITPRGHPSSFPEGYDLHHEGLPWEIPLSSIAIAVGRKAVLRQQLLNEGLVTQADLDRCRALAPTKKRLDPRITLYRLRQPFPIAFHRGLHVWVVGDTEVKPWTYTYMFADSRAQYRPLVRPYTGSALAQFELSPLPEHTGTDTVVMRIVKMLAAPVCVLPGYDHATPMPVEGELVRRPMGRARSSRLQPWFCDVAADPSDSAAALRMLVEVRSPTPFFSSPPFRAKTK
ncbi:hypothetical protein B0H19DRAFT_1261738 [Mycena capillaripes]|nr:hypothetical protein B0H19DRAFT_1261738 [Mycena capillaripes]